MQIEQINSHLTTTRGTLVQMLVSALSNKKYLFGRQAALKWLGIFPGDLGIKLFLSKFYKGERNNDQAIEIVKSIIDIDPEYLQAYEFLKTLPVSIEEKEYCEACCHALGGRVSQKNGLPAWSPALHAVQKSISNEKIDDASQLVFRILSLKQDIALINVAHLKTVYLNQDTNTVLKLAELYHQKWPNALQFKMVLAEQLLETGDEDRAVNLLHDCVSQDATGQVARRWWGNNHVFLPLWPEKLEFTLDLQIPNEVSLDMGWNKLPVGSPDLINLRNNSNNSDIKSANDKESFVRSETGYEVKKEFDRIAKKLRKNVNVNLDGRFPAYVIMTTKTGLVKQYGEQTYKIIYQFLHTIQLLVQSKPGWDAVLFIPDEPLHQKEFGTSQLAAIDPWKIKTSLKELDAALLKRGEKIGSLLIVGGDEIVPFHRLPNPTDDVDDEIISDNPYGNLDGNYFIPDWPVGRLIGEKGKDAGLLIQQIRSIIKYHSQPKSVLAIWERIFRSFTTMFTQNNLSSFGYTASVWKLSSNAVFRPIGETKNMYLSPTNKSQGLKPENFVNSDLAYFNLHGVVNRAEWYGQRDVNDPPGVDYPVAISPDDIKANGQAPQIVFTEACYGAHVFNKYENESIGLKYLSVGVPVVIGSTCTSYGSIASPLIAADLLGNRFWQYIREGLLAGEAFMRAKINLVHEMTSRQGYLDGEDQKTLIQFVYYGDPFFAYESTNKANKRINQIGAPDHINAICDIETTSDGNFDININTIKNMKSILEPYLPGIEHATVKFNQLQTGFDRSIKGIDSSIVSSKTIKDKYVVTLKNPVQINRTRYYQIARVTVDSKGNLIKMSVSR